MATTNQNIQISLKLFTKLFLYFNAPVDFRTAEQEKQITDEINERYERWYNHNVFTQYRQSETDDDRLKFLREYLDRTGVPEDFRVLLRSDQPTGSSTQENRPD